MPFVDLAFPVVGSSIPRDHGYALYGALCRKLAPAPSLDHRLVVLTLRPGPEFRGSGRSSTLRSSARAWRDHGAASRPRECARKPHSAARARHVAGWCDECAGT